MPKPAKKKKKAAKKPATRKQARKPAKPKSAKLKPAKPKSAKPKPAKPKPKERELDAGAVAAIALALQDEEIAAKRAAQLNGASQWTSLARVRGVRGR